MAYNSKNKDKHKQNNEMHKIMRDNCVSAHKA